MASHEADREDLLRQATALVERVELRYCGCTEPVVAGFRRDGSASFFFGVDPVFQFTAAGALRRAYQRGLLYKADRGRLRELARERTANEVVLRSRELSDSEARALCEGARTQLRVLAETLRAGEFELLGQVPAGGQVVERTLVWLAVLPEALAIATRPHAG